MHLLRSYASLRGAAALCGAAAVSFVTGLASPRLAEACGCFAPPDPAVPVIQAGERILFAHQNGQVIAQIQIQYSGQPGDFGWLLPLPSVPMNKMGQPGIDIGVDELFSQLTTTTQPKYRLNRVYEMCGSGIGPEDSPQANTDLANGAGGAAPGSPGPGMGPLVVQSTVGPYDFAILKADSQDDMLNWLMTNRYFVPSGTDSVLGPYIRPGAYFLALKLQTGLSAGDLQPVVLNYQSDLPMIPIILTSVAATPNMGIQVWMLGDGRAIPRNYYHTIINDAQINWFTAGQNYNDVIIQAVGEANGKHSFVTEYAGSSGVMRNVLDSPGRFNNLPMLATLSDPIGYVQQALTMFALNGQFTTIVSRYIPLPAALASSGVTLGQYYQNIGFYLGQDRLQNPDKYADIAMALANFAPAMLTAELQSKIAQPTLDAGTLFTTFPYLTRLYTTLSPQDMNSDPVFSYNPSLPDYPNVHDATLTYHCAGFFSQSRYSDATLDTPEGFHLDFTVDQASGSVWNPIDAPYSQQIQILQETGDPQIVADNTSAIRSALGQSGCSQSGPAVRRGGANVALTLLLGMSGLLYFRRRRRLPTSRLS